MNEIRAVARARLEAAEAFAEVAELLGTDLEPRMRSVSVTLAVHAGIASADAICATQLGRYAHGAKDYRQAVDLLGSVDKRLATALGRLVRHKTAAAYLPRTLSVDDVQTAARAMSALLDAAREMVPRA